MAALVAQNAAVVATPPPAAPEPPDPRPLIADAVLPVARRLEEIAATAEAAAVGSSRVAQTLGEMEARFRAPDAQLLTVFRALSRILAVRVLLFLALAGGFSLAVMAMVQQSWLSLALVVAFVLLTVGPLAYLEIAGRPAKEPT